MKRFSIILCVAAGLLLPASAVAGDDATAQDIRCFMIAAQQAASENTETRSTGINATLYWLGRLDGRTPGLDLEKQIMAELPSLTGAMMQSETERCRGILGQRGQALITLGQAMIKKGEEEKQRQNSQ